MNATKLTWAIRPQSGFTLVDIMVAFTVVVASFTALYALGAQCMSLTSSGRELTSAQQVLQDRIEQLRNLQWTQVTDANYLANNVFNQASGNGTYLNSLTETVSVNAYPTASTAASVTVVNGTVTSVITNSAIASGDLCRVDITESWTARRTGQARSITNTTVQANKSR